MVWLISMVDLDRHTTLKLIATTRICWKNNQADNSTESSLSVWKYFETLVNYVETMWTCWVIFRSTINLLFTRYYGYVDVFYLPYSLLFLNTYAQSCLNKYTRYQLSCYAIVRYRVLIHLISEMRNRKLTRKKRSQFFKVRNSLFNISWQLF